ncbi:MAG TPA: sugar phosphate isomerase/epimerase family protein [Pirellulales bacterium]|jgi:sugar phosphate isomerase/epimerase|nr:sugar phosphate isomerase/epimerase family protein [Pirellulales bacterium]
MTLELTRRDFLRVAGGAAAAISVGRSGAAVAAQSEALRAHPLPPLAVFGKVYQELKLDFEPSARVTAAAGLDGVDCAVRKKGEIVPERAAEDMPRYAAALGKHGLRMLLMTTDILGAHSPYAEEILAAGHKLGIRYYRLGYWSHRPEQPARTLVAEIQASLKDLAAINRQTGMGALFQNHSSPGSRLNAPAGGDLDELYDIVKDFDPSQIAVAFDLGHAIITHGDGWRERFERLKNHIRVVYVKDVRRPAKFVPFGDGEFSHTDFFALLKKIDYDAPMSIHIEYDWAPDGKKTEAAMIETLQRSRRAVADWWQHAT